MPNYDFATLSPLDFEQLLNDLVQAEKGLQVERFGAGKDGGIDGRYTTFEGTGIVQAKHYRKSSFSQLKNGLLNSKQQILELEPQYYMVGISRSLTPENKNQLVELLSPLPIRTEDIWANEDINALLSKHPDVEKSHIKLWLNSTGVLDRFIHAKSHLRSEAVFWNIQRDVNVFVSYNGYHDAQKVIDEQNILIITGPPGVGKTTLAHVICAGYLEDNWDLVAINDIEEALECFSTEKKQVFLFDDFLGTIQFDRFKLSKNEPDLQIFINIVRKNSINTRFVLTSRKYIYEEAQIASEMISDEVLRLSDVVVDLNSYASQTKSEILYNHLFFSNLEEEYISELVDSGYLKKIIEHKNYMPRIVRWLTEGIRLRSITARQYPIFFLDTLENPEEIWKIPFEEHIKPAARLMLYCIYFIPRYSSMDKIKFRAWFDQAVAELSRKQNFTIGDREYENALKVLEGSFIDINGSTISYVNPSVQDYIRKRLLQSDVLEILAGAIITRNQAFWIWKFVKKEISSHPKLTKLAKILANKCLTVDSVIKGEVSLFWFLELADDLSKKINDRSAFNAVITKQFLDTLDLDIAAMPQLFEGLDINIYDFPNVEWFREYLSHRFVLELQNNSLDIEEAVNVLSSADEYPNYLKDEELEAISEMAADVALSTIAPCTYDSHESDWDIFAEQVETLERWVLPTHIIHLKEQLGEYFYNKQQHEDEMMEEYRLYGRKAQQSRSDQNDLKEYNEAHYRKLFSSLVPDK